MRCIEQVWQPEENRRQPMILVELLILAFDREFNAGGFQMPISLHQ